jgi:hypothetical protein
MSNLGMLIRKFIKCLAVGGHEYDLKMEMMKMTERKFGDIKKCESLDMLFGYCTGVISALGGVDVIDDICEAKKNIHNNNNERIKSAKEQCRSVSELSKITKEDVQSIFDCLK